MSPRDSFELSSVTERASRLRVRLDGLRDGRLFLLVVVPLVILYMLTATWSRPVNIDAFSNVLPAWKVGTEGTFFLDEYGQLADPDYFGNVGWVVPAGDTFVSQYPPGTALFAAPLYAVWPQDARVATVVGSNRPDAAPIEVLIPPLGPGAIAASVATAAAIGLLAIVFRLLSGSAATALLAAFLAGLGTSAWSVASDQLWQHGPAMAWIALGLVLASRRPVASGFALGAAILTRPLTALIAAATGLYQSWKERSLRPVLLTGIGAAVGLVLFIAYNAWVFGDPSISAGYGEGFQNNALSTDLGGYVRNVFLGLFSATRGVLIWSPFLLLLVPGLRAAWRAAPGWVRGSALGGALYLLIQYKANRFSGGGGFFAYRYPLEALAASAPLLFLAHREYVTGRPRLVKAFVAMASLSVVLHGTGALELISM